VSSTIFFIGASGFLGRHVCKALQAAGHEVQTVGRGGGGVLSPTIRFDLLRDDPAKLFKDHVPETLVHFAWETTLGTFWSDPSNVDWVAASLRLFRAYAAAGGQHFLVAGTCMEYDLSGDRALDEHTSPMRPNCTYAAAKLSLFQCLDWAAKDTDIAVSWIRVFHPFGPGEPASRLVPHIARKLKAGLPVLLSDGKQTRDFMHVSDFAQAVRLVVESRWDGPINIATGQATSIEELATLLAQIDGRQELLKFGALPRRALDPSHIVGRGDRLKALGFQPARTLQESLEAFYRQV
jgi:nucleoside-diphosphate-sugar epimerase